MRRVPIKPMTLDPSNASDPALSRPQRIMRKLKHEVKEFIVMFLYLWVMFSLFVMYGSILRAEQHQDFKLHGFAFINALILAKVMLVGEGMQLAHGRGDSRPIFVILKKSFAFALLFICFHVLEHTIMGVVHGKTIAASFLELVGGRRVEIIILALLVSVCLIPFFAFREVDRNLGEGRLLQILTSRPDRND
jgi:hypothetical protein